MTRMRLPVITIKAKDWPFAMASDTVEELEAKARVLEAKGYMQDARRCWQMIRRKLEGRL